MLLPSSVTPHLTARTGVQQRAVRPSSHHAGAAAAATPTSAALDGTPTPTHHPLQLRLRFVLRRRRLPRLQQLVSLRGLRGARSGGARGACSSPRRGRQQQLVPGGGDAGGRAAASPTARGRLLLPKVPLAREVAAIGQREHGGGGSSDCSLPRRGDQTSATDAAAPNAVARRAGLLLGLGLGLGGLRQLSGGGSALPSPRLLRCRLVRRCQLLRRRQ